MEHQRLGMVGVGISDVYEAISVVVPSQTQLKGQMFIAKKEVTILKYL
jgi:hypothetical protein